MVLSGRFDTRFGLCRDLDSILLFHLARFAFAQSSKSIYSLLPSHALRRPLSLRCSEIIKFALTLGVSGYRNRRATPIDLQSGINGNPRCFSQFLPSPLISH